MTAKFEARRGALLAAVLAATLVGCPAEESAPGPELTLSATRVDFGPIRAGGALPDAKTVDVGYSRGGTLASTLVAVAYPGATSGWLEVDLDGSGSAWTLTVRPSTTAVPEGLQLATVEVCASGAACRTLTVVLEISRDELSPVIAVDKARLTFTSAFGGAAAAAQELSIASAGTGVLDNVTIVCDQAWLTVTPSVPMPIATASGVTVTVAAGLEAGRYAGTLTITDDHAVNSPLLIPVVYTVTQPTIAASVPGLSFSLPYGASPAAKSFTVSNSGTGTLPAPTVTSTAAWLGATVGGTSAPFTVVVSVEAGALPSGTWSGMLILEAAGASNSLVLPVSVSVEATPVARDLATAGGGAAMIMDAYWARNLSCEKIGAVFVAIGAEHANGSALRRRASVDAGRIAYDPAMATECLAAIEAATCAELDGGSGPAVCDGVFTGTVADGDVCGSSDECATGWCDAGITCPWLCAARKPEGSDCSDSGECLSGACDWATHLCVPDVPGAEGEPCGRGVDSCLPGLYCDSGVCRPRLAVAEYCSGFNNDCQTGLGCAEDRRCRPLVPVGESCAAAACGMGVYCSAAAGTRCADIPWRAGDDCAEHGGCWGLGCASSGLCVEGTVPAGGVCDASADLFCVEGTRCSAFTGWCTPFSDGVAPCP